MAKLHFILFALLVVTVSSAPGSLNGPGKTASRDPNSIDRSINKLRTQFSNYLVRLPDVMYEVERAENVYNRDLRRKVSVIVTQTRRDINEMIKNNYENIDIARCIAPVYKLGAIEADVIGNVTGCIAAAIVPEEGPSIFDIAVSAMGKLNAMRNQIITCGGAFHVDTPEDADEFNETEEEDRPMTLPTEAREIVDCDEVTSKVSAIVDKAIESMAMAWKDAGDILAIIKLLTDECEAKSDYVDRLTAVVGEVKNCVENDGRVE